jgi:hypothetical protein
MPIPQELFFLVGWASCPSHQLRKRIFARGLLNREDAKDTKEEPPTSRALSLSEKPGFCRGSAKSAYSSPATRSIGIAAIGHGHKK